MADPSLPIEDPQSVRLQVPYFSQGDKINLCWAACCQMVLAAAGRPETFCSIVSEGLGGDCCASANADDDLCDQAHWPNDVYTHHGMVPLYVPNALSFANLEYEINGRRPVNAVLTWTDGGSHVLVIAGYYFNGDLLVNDPKYGQGRFGYDYVLAAYNLGSWNGTIYNLAATR